MLRTVYTVKHTHSNTFKHTAMFRTVYTLTHSDTHTYSQTHSRIHSYTPTTLKHTHLKLLTHTCTATYLA